MTKKISQVDAIKNVSIYSAYLLIVWGLYRLLFKLPEEVEEMIVKPLVWLLPLGYLLKRERVNLASVGVTFKNLFPSLYFVLGLGAVFAIEAVVINMIKHGGTDFGANIGANIFSVSLLLSFFTSISEELAFRGYIFNRLKINLHNEWLANLITTTIWVLIHVPVVVFIWKLNFVSGLIYLLVTAFFGLGSAFVYARTGNIFSSIILHVLWEWPIILFR